MKSKSLAAAAMLLLGSTYGASAFAATNPVDSAGIQHNMYLGCLLDTGASPADSLTYVVEKCGFDAGMPTAEYVKANQPILDLDPTMPLAQKMAPQRARYSAYEFSFFERIDQIVAKSADLDQAGAMFAELEAEAIAQLDAKSRNGKTILGGLSVARHTTRFWAEYAAAHGGGSETGKRRWWQWLIVAAVDVGGYLLSENVGTAASASNTVHGWFEP